MAYLVFSVQYSVAVRSVQRSELGTLHCVLGTLCMLRRHDAVPPALPGAVLSMRRVGRPHCGNAGLWQMPGLRTISAMIGNNPPPVDPRRWYRCVLRPLPIFAIVLLVACGWLLVRVQRANRQSEAAEAILKCSGCAVYFERPGNRYKWPGGEESFCNCDVHGLSLELESDCPVHYRSA